MTEELVYMDLLEDLFKDYDGIHSDLLKEIPRFFKLLQKIYSSPELDWDLKFRINACFSYFALPEDLIPDWQGPEGYLDDLFICAQVLDYVRINNTNLLIDFWECEDNIIKRVQEVLRETKKLIPKETINILRFVGLLKFEDMIKDFGPLLESTDINSKIERIDMKVFDLMAILKTIFLTDGKRPNDPNLRKISGLKEYFTNEQWIRVVNVLEKVELHESTYDTTVETEFERLRHKVLLDIDETLLGN